jgi:hypothetical protein
MVAMIKSDSYSTKRDLLRERIGHLPEPRIWTPKDLAAFFGMTVYWVRHQTEKKCTDPPPRVQGTSQLRFDTQSLDFLLWLARRLGIDTTDLVDGNGYGQ